MSSLKKYYEIKPFPKAKIHKSHQKSIQDCLRVVNDIRNQYAPIKVLQQINPVKEIAALVTTYRKMKPPDVIHHCNIPPKEKITISFNTSDFKRVVLNILNNAYEAILENSIKKITVKESLYNSKGTKMYLLEIADNGFGIDGKTQKNIFKYGFTTKEYGRGTGLGLAICKSIIQRSNGTIKVRSRLGEGTRFLIAIPLTPKAPSKQDLLQKIKFIDYASRPLLIHIENETFSNILAQVIDEQGGLSHPCKEIKSSKILVRYKKRRILISQNLMEVVDIDALKAKDHHIIVLRHTQEIPPGTLGVEKIILPVGVNRILEIVRN